MSDRSTGILPVLNDLGGGTVFRWAVLPRPVTDKAAEASAGESGGFFIPFSPFCFLFFFGGFLGGFFVFPLSVFCFWHKLNLSFPRLIRATTENSSRTYLHRQYLNCILFDVMRNAG